MGYRIAGRVAAISSFAVLAGALCAGELPRVAPAEVGMSESRLARVAERMDSLVAQGEFPGMLAMIARRGSVVFEHAVGTLDVETGAPLEMDSLMRIYSMTKPITSVAAMTLVEDGKLLLDAPVAMHFPEWKELKVLEDGEQVPASTAVTARHLLMHTSGLTYGYYGDTPVDRMYREAKLIDDWDYLTHDTRELVLKLADIPLLFEPGSRWHYGFSSDVLGHLVERVSGQPLDGFFEDRLFSPLGMDDSYFDVPDAALKRFGTDHHVTDGEVIVQDSPREDPEFRDVTFLSGGGGLVMTADNYMRFCLMLASGGSFDGARILSPATVALMTTNLLAAGDSAGGDGFGLGFAIAPAGPSRSTLTPGSYYWGGAAGTFFWIDPNLDLVAIFMPQRIGSPPWIQQTLQNMVYAAVE
ncbi:MAG: beta-lactamase family protein [Gammaproteobacteria bacterium]|nr:beta-lactamase family protein [Gammaproteobacteria bacterium]MYB37953.1 beta-lactamase family protein [Gammaproteobacteria bacterium]